MNDSQGHSSETFRNVRFITLRMANHAAASGWDRITEFVPGHVLPTRMPATYASRAVAKVLDPLAVRSGSAWYHRANLWTEVVAARHWLSARREVFHFLYGENSYRYLASLCAPIRRRNWLIATYHTPGWRLRDLVKARSAIARLDGVTVVSTSQAEEFADVLGGERVHYVPHGIDTQYFQPDPKARLVDRFRCITVGTHMRDYDALRHAAEALRESHPEIEFVVVAHEDRLAPLRRLRNVTCFNRVTDDVLLDLYRSASALVLPVTDATANNTLLEGMACGLPVISTDLPAVRDYVTPECAVLTPKGDADALAGAVVAAVRRGQSLRTVAAASRCSALRFDWVNVAKMLTSVYERTAALTGTRA